MRTPFDQRADAPRQPAADVAGRLEFFAGHGYEDALDGLAQWSHAWVLFVFDRNVQEGRGWKPKVQPPRSDTKRGVFSTRSPHRPNPIGLSVVKIERVEGLVVHVTGLDILDGSPMLDVKPYVAYADAHPDARAGWLAVADPVAPWAVDFASAALEQIAWLRDNGVDLEPSIRSALALGPQPHAYRRIRAHAGGMRLALKEWRADFVVEARRIVVVGVTTGYRPKALAEDPALDLHRLFAGRFGVPSALGGS